jgi:hypothetical protein
VLLLVCETLEELQQNVRDAANDLIADDLCIGRTRESFLFPPLKSSLDDFKDLDLGHQRLIRDVVAISSNLSEIYDTFAQHLRSLQIEAKSEAEQVNLLFTPSPSHSFRWPKHLTPCAVALQI